MHQRKWLWRATVDEFWEVKDEKLGIVWTDHVERLLFRWFAEVRKHQPARDVSFEPSTEDVV